MVHFGVISAYPDEDWHSQQIVNACAAKGHVDAFAPTGLSIRVGDGKALVEVDGRDAREWDVWLLPRALGDEGDHGFQCTVYRALGELGVPVVNPIGALLDAKDKARSSWLLARAGVATPATMAVQSIERARAALEELTCGVAKPPYGSLGQGVVRVSRRDRRAGSILGGLLGEHGVVYLQKLVGSGKIRQDLRVFVVGDRAPAAMLRRAKPGEFRTNVHQGGRARALRPDSGLEALAVRAAKALGLEYAGVDLIEAEWGPTVIEVNGTPRWEGILAATGRDMAVEIVAHAAALAIKARGPGERREERRQWTRAEAK